MREMPSSGYDMSSWCLPGGARHYASLVRPCATRRLASSADYGSTMATIVLRVRLLSGECTDLSYEDPEQVDEVGMLEHVIEVLREESGVLRCRHGNRLVVLYSRGVASIEVSPRVAIL